MCVRACVSVLIKSLLQVPDMRLVSEVRELKRIVLATQKKTDSLEKQVQLMCSISVKLTLCAYAARVTVVVP